MSLFSSLSFELFEEPLPPFFSGFNDGVGVSVGSGCFFYNSISYVASRSLLLKIATQISFVLKFSMVFLSSEEE